MDFQYQMNSEIQAADGLRTLYFMNPNLVGFADADSNTDAAVQAAAFGSSPPCQGQFKITSPSSTPQDAGRPSEQVPAAVNRSAQYNLSWGVVDNNPINLPPQPLSLNLPYDHRHRYNDCRQELQSTGGGVLVSKYVKVAQELLEEVASVLRKETHKEKTVNVVVAKTEEVTVAIAGGTDHRNCNNLSGGGGCDQLTTAQRQEILMKKAKLGSLLDEVDQRCKQYRQQMQMVVSSFEQFAGMGSARSYTQVALRTMLKQFRCLKTAVLRQIKGLNRSLGLEEEEDDDGDRDQEGQGSRRLRMVDHRVRQQRALHQMGLTMTSSNTRTTMPWRQQRGLPERAVALLRAWLFEHFLHPYPKDSDKRMLAKQTGLTRSQVSNWFINARVRLWKPMVEEMYLEEIQNQKQQQQQQQEDINHDYNYVNEEQQQQQQPAGGAYGTCSTSTSSSSCLIQSCRSSSRPHQQDQYHHSNQQHTSFAHLITSLALPPPTPTPTKPNPNPNPKDRTMAASGYGYGYGYGEHMANNGFSLSLGLGAGGFDFTRPPTHSQSQIINHRPAANGNYENTIVDFQGHRMMMTMRNNNYINFHAASDQQVLHPPSFV
ncbi:BEL1-like homeodomain protein 1 [Andrographis paniculata]|uniref:BEL1-like homeodomain protein 1 n=1 Tax=Andrographis paniculata TaxID=175694 RepID=UPI0021E7DFA9|nr:BEL1-like homeodomain protein 1 [Andrographis paniculata]XP_051142438.1 BEL1-like homeodomain protein 1 [Andrographis paniculata]